VFKTHVNNVAIMQYYNKRSDKGYAKKIYLINNCQQYVAGTSLQPPWLINLKKFSLLLLGTSDIC